MSNSTREELKRIHCLEEWKKDNLLPGQLPLPYPPADDGTRFELEPEGGDAVYGKTGMMARGPYAA